MGSLINGKWYDEPITSSNALGEFDRQQSIFRDFISPEEAVPGRYHLYISYACPWAHRTLIVRSLKKLEDVIAYSVTNPFMGEKGWTFGIGHEVEYLSNVYLGANALYTGKVTVPVLWDYRKETIVNNESSEILRMFNSSFDAYTESKIDLYPAPLRPAIDEINDKIYTTVNNGVYKTGFAANQAAYEKSFLELFETLNEMETLLGLQQYLVGDKITEADIRFFTTLIRFDVVYYVHFKCNLSLIRDYPNLSNYLRALYQIPEIKSTCYFDHIKQHYYQSHKFLNPRRLVPLGPVMELDGVHNRGKPEFYSSVRSGHLS